MTITPLMLKALRADVDAILAPLRAKYGLSKLGVGKISYDPGAGCCTLKVEGVAEGAQGKDAARYEAHAQLLGLPPLGFQFKQGRGYKTAGLNSTGSKVLCERDDGKQYLFAVEAIKRFAATTSFAPTNHRRNK